MIKKYLLALLGLAWVSNLALAGDTTEIKVITNCQFSIQADLVKIRPGPKGRGCTNTTKGEALYRNAGPKEGRFTVQNKGEKGQACEYRLRFHSKELIHPIKADLILDRPAITYRCQDESFTYSDSLNRRRIGTVKVGTRCVCNKE